MISDTAKLTEELTAMSTGATEPDMRAVVFKISQILESMAMDRARGEIIAKNEIREEFGSRFDAIDKRLDTLENHPGPNVSTK